MTEILDTVADLTHLRDKRELEAMFAELICELVGASRLVLWRAGLGGGGKHMHRRLILPEGAATGEENVVFPGIPAMGNSICVEDEVGGAFHYVFAIHEGGRSTGVIEILRPERLTRPETLTVSRLIRVYNNHAGLLDYGNRDELTGLLNRRGFNSYFHQAVQEEQAVIAVADIDFFKRINDEFGHLYGDEVLILMGRLMESCLGEMGGVFRFGGEEFLVILHNTPLGMAAIRLEAFRNAVQSAVFPQVGRVTISVGFSAVRADDTGASAFGRADEALYVAKQHGRNQVRCYEWLVLDGLLREQKKSGGQIELF
ncbi:GGDEF domain-containing protein [Acidocella aromatica]|uniref:diguanylate cyclase n=1 Tax=Acidocella aromatica TaxID=1303579 RepID=A0A840V7X7_9PROT|nr:GGDEF domain-containing protein [Acidocella aromatica]MBB5371856.1 diguanylate cyclase (GGDEF)-like protein [Acidocella aromatica]